MALIKCPECGGSISDKAISCPSCGLPISEHIPVERKLNKTITDYKGLRGQMKSVNTTSTEIILKKLFGGQEYRINVNDITDIKYCKASFSANGFVTFCTTNGIGNNITNTVEAINDTQSICFNLSDNKNFKEFASDLCRQLEIDLIVNNLMTSAQLSQKELEEKHDKIRQMDKEGIAYCPKCYSTSLTAEKKGFGIGKAVIGAAVTGGIIGLTAGNINAKKVRVTCLKCGYQFWAGKK